MRSYLMLWLIAVCAVVSAWAAVDMKNGVPITTSTVFDGQSGIGSINGQTVKSGTSLVLFYEYSGGLTNVSGKVEDSSTAGNDGDPGLGGALPTWSAATNGMTNIVTYDGGDSITSDVSETHATIMFWATSGSVWRSYIKSGGSEYVNGATQAFDETYFYSVSGDVITWGDGFTGDQTLQRIWQTEQTDTDGMHWTQAADVGYSQWDADNRSDWSNTLFIGTFAYDLPADTSPNGYHAWKSAGAAAPTHGGDANVGWYVWDGADTIGTDYDAQLMVGTQGTFAAWIYPTTNNDYGTYIAVADDASSTSFLLLSSHGANNSVRYYFNNAGTANRLDAPVGELDAATWQHWVFTSDGSTVKCYKNGVQKTLTVTAGANAGAWFGNVPSSDEWRLGVLRYNGTFANYYDGRMSHVRQYGVGLSSNEVYTLYNDTKYQFGL